ncbi:hypothetical protein KJ815_11800, partial [bacterium]|nr:hypothetical protein [bacterium]
MNAVWTHPRTWPIWDVLFPPLCTVCERPLDRDAILFCAQCWADAPTAELAGVRKPVHVDL